MRTFTEVEPMQRWLQTQVAAGRKVGFIPTMGALHAGHLSLVQQAKTAGDLSVVSIFVNPTQFNDPNDLAKYPRTPEADIALLEQVDNDVLFMPSVKEVYPADENLTVTLDFGPLANVLEGAFRPGHFQGMATVVWRLLNIVQPNNLYMGQKDYQQSAIVARMLELFASPIKLIVCKSLRENDGLAMSSRNVRLNPEMREVAPSIYAALQKCKAVFREEIDIDAAIQAGLAHLPAPPFKVDYFAIADGLTLQPILDSETCLQPVALVATWLDGVRLIDNILLND